MRPADIFVYVFLPPFLFDLAVRIDFFMLKKRSIDILFMAFVMVASITMLLIPFLLYALDLQVSGGGGGEERGKGLADIPAGREQKGGHTANVRRSATLFSASPPTLHTFPLPLPPPPIHMQSSGWTARNVALFGACIASTDAAAVSAILSSGEGGGGGPKAVHPHSQPQ